MNIIDIIIGIILLFGLVRGFMKGFIVELASLVALVLGIYGAINFSHFALDYLNDYVSWDQEYIKLAAFALTFLLIVILILILGKLLTKLAGLIALGIVNRILGGVFGTLKYAFIISVLLMLLNGFNKNISFLEDEKVENSVLYKPVETLAPMVLPPVLEEFEEQNRFSIE
ncbi:CvpA family protein [Mesonia aquimarina]|uniref:CvpA family protein n=1 Tax=Mesonia aquimarina TaxID=1504967 RepID=UPI000EF55FDF|nr:CvpA family protein [Mesonia aquimarina]